MPLCRIRYPFFLSFLPWCHGYQGAKFQGETLHLSVPVRCQYSSRFTTMEKPILHTSWLLFVEQCLIHTWIDIFCNCLRALDSLHTLSARKFREWKTTPDARMHGEEEPYRKEKVFVFHAQFPSVDCKLQLECLQLCCRQKYMRTNSDRQVAKAFIFYSQVERLRVGGLFPVIHILALEKADV